ncbi:hypothetical protein PHAVU_008G272300 [Phaseolus vulgaris]|uniref:F-box domain-containing protein n=1 Tax=Phaseolus vulgaris TaxID=3885 RepID=V7B9S7_PHAVU|nr:hypothetical protein PHAVU_008G272300g [Phaseolus vulgaris]ESW14335.1 hypothetical protein PHAVU_008G272300g [Phaseolus vulgaris]
MKRGNFSFRRRKIVVNLAAKENSSRLPHELLLKILSFLNVRFVVQTCFLSKRWRHIWNFVNSFMSAIDSSSNIYKLRLECENELDDHDIRKLYVRIYSIIDYVTHTLSISTTIQVITISVESVCVNLQYLYFHSCVYYGDVKNFIISVFQLIQLDISGFRMDEMFDEDELVTPMLKYFKYHDSNLYSFSSKIDLNFVERIDMDEDINSLYRLIELFEILRQVKFISFSTEIIQDQSSTFTRMQTFELINDITFTSGIPSAVKAYLFGETL